MAYSPLLVVAFGLGWWIARRKQLWPFFWAAASAVLPPVALVLCQLEKRSPRRDVIVGVITTSLISMALFVGLELIRNVDFCSRFAAAFSAFVLSCCGQDVLANGRSVEGWDTHVELSTPLDLWPTTVVSTFFVVIFMFNLEQSRRLMLLLIGSMLGLIGDMIRMPVRVWLCLQGAIPDSESRFSTYFSLLILAQTILYVIAAILSIKFALEGSARSPSAVAVESKDEN